MTEKLEVYRCSICGNIVEVLHGAAGELVCCGKPMELLKENTTDAAKEKHVPVIEKAENGYNIKIGSAKHPMIKEHYIEWIELIADGRSYKKFLNPYDEPEVFFKISADSVTAREYCNLHKFWKAEL